MGPEWEEAAELARAEMLTTTAFVTRAVRREIARVRRRQHRELPWQEQ